MSSDGNCRLYTKDWYMESVICNDFDYCNGDNLQNRYIIISFDESESYSLHDWEYTDKGVYGVVTELHSFPASSTTFM